VEEIKIMGGDGQIMQCFPSPAPLQPGEMFLTAAASRAHLHYKGNGIVAGVERL
jgi:hypothetical protein